MSNPFNLDPGTKVTIVPASSGDKERPAEFLGYLVNEYGEFSAVVRCGSRQILEELHPSRLRVRE